MINVDESVILELTDRHHALRLFELVDRNREHLGKWLPWVDFMQTAENFSSFVEGVLKRHEAREEAGFVIVYEGEIAGRIGLYYIDHQNKIASIGYWLGATYQGKGIVTRACRQIIHYGFTVLDLNRIEIKCGTENYKSQEVPERLGFIKEGMLRQAELHKDHFIDLYLFSLLKEDWKP